MENIAFHYSPLFLRHHPGPGHPEESDRLDSILAAVGKAGLELDRREPSAARREWLLSVHDSEMIDGLERFHQSGGGMLDPDTSMSAESWPAALAAAGALASAVQDVLSGEGPRRAFCATRPPGHHATRSRAMGFCLLNNVAVGAARALELGCERVAIVDFDVHHGNGTESIFYEDPRVLYVSTHQFPFYPGTGRAQDTGRGKGAGYTLNVPLAAGTDDATYRQLFDEVVLPRLEEFGPRLLMISAGFDAHEADPLGGLRLSTGMFAEITSSLAGVAARHCAGRIVSTLEGGYDRRALAESTVAHLAALAAEK